MNSTKPVAFFVLFVSLSFFSTRFHSEAIGQDTVAAPPQNLDGMWGFQAPAQYTILPRPATHTNKGLSNISTPPVANIQSRPTQPYAYGWFGTKPSPQWSRQFGHQKAYTQWTLK